MSAPWVVLVASPGKPDDVRPCSGPMDAAFVLERIARVLGLDDSSIDFIRSALHQGESWFRARIDPTHTAWVGVEAEVTRRRRTMGDA